MERRSLFNRQTPATALLYKTEGLNQAVSQAMSAETDGAVCAVNHRTDEPFPLFASGKLVSNIHAIFPIQEAEAAHGVLRRAENIGKAVLDFGYGGLRDKNMNSDKGTAAVFCEYYVNKGTFIK